MRSTVARATIARLRITPSDTHSNTIHSCGPHPTLPHPQLNISPDARMQTEWAAPHATRTTAAPVRHLTSNPLTLPRISRPALSNRPATYRARDQKGNAKIGAYRSAQ